ncbi:MAG TPA: HlyD family efflux transporter periplasmic adaptor subunit [Candidatus Saccharimonadales bacterium]|jgi:HlyD family secretion protein|nr:HlyD family efflux transporter periplasmic adaptor subunit [Candidatus Saccharimonadales bacterium]
MDIARDESVLRNKKRNRLIIAIVAVVALVLITLGVSRLKPAAPFVDHSSVWSDVVKRGPMLRQVRGLGLLVPIPEDVRFITSETDVRVERILVLPGTLVKPDTYILELSDPRIVQEAMDADLQLKAALAEIQNLKVKLEGDLLTQKAASATVNADYQDAKRLYESNLELVKIGVLSDQALKTSQGKSQELATRNQIEKERIAMNSKAISTQLDVQVAKIDQMRALTQLKHKQLAALKVQAGITGVLQELPLQVGQRAPQGTILAKVVQPEHLKAELKIPETQAKDIQIGQEAEVDTHNGVVKGTVMRVDPAVQGGTVTVDVKLEGNLPKGARPDLSVDGVITLERMNDVLFMARPAFGQERTTVGIFKMDPGEKTAVRVQVELGRGSVSNVEIIRGLQVGDKVIVSDMSRWDKDERIRLE